MPPSVALIIVNYNGGSFLPSLAESLRAVTYAEARFYLVDNASSDGSGELLGRLFPDAEVVLNRRNLGLAAAINQALRQALPSGPDHVLLLNPDTKLAPDFLARLVEVSDGHTLVVPRVLTPDGRLAGHAGRFDLGRGLLLQTLDGEPAASPAALTSREVETGSFSCMLVPAAAFEAVGLLDERLGMYYEDTDFCLRARRAGFGIAYQPAALVWHQEGGSSGGRESPFAVYYTTRNRPYVVRKHASRATFAAFSAYFLAGRLVRALSYAKGRDWTRLRAMLRGLADFYRGRMGMSVTPQDLR